MKGPFFSLPQWLTFLTGLVSAYQTNFVGAEIRFLGHLEQIEKEIHSGNRTLYANAGNWSLKYIHLRHVCHTTSFSIVVMSRMIDFVVRFLAFLYIDGVDFFMSLRKQSPRNPITDISQPTLFETYFDLVTFYIRGSDDPLKLLTTSQVTHVRMGTTIRP